MFRVRLLIALLVLLAASVGLTSDLEKEKRWADQIVDALIEGEAVWLPIDRHEVLAIFTEAEEPDSRLAAIIVHGIGVHPNWQRVVNPLRTGLPPRGWNTLSSQMPILPNEADPGEYAAIVDEVGPRVDAGIAFLRERGFDKVVIVGHSLGSTMAACDLATGDHGVAGFVAIGMPDGIPNSTTQNVGMVPKITAPMLDLYGSDDFPDVLAAVAQRGKVKSAGSGGPYWSKSVEGAKHFFDGKEDALVETLDAWLRASVVGS
jgi:pimeloyl-ACP methyl ester carboxylesterase